MATDYVKQILDAEGALTNTGVDPGAQALYDQLNRYLASLSEAQRQYLIAAVSQVAGGPLGINFTGLAGIQQGDLQSLANNIQQLTGKSQMKGANQQVPGSVETQQAYDKAHPAQGMGASPTQLGLTGAITGALSPTAPTTTPSTTSTTGTTTPATTGVLTETSGLTQQQYIDLMRLWGLSSTAEVDAMVGAYRQSYYVTYALNQNADFVAGPGSLTSTDATGAPLAGAATANAPSSPFAAYQQEVKALGTAGVGQSPWTMSLQQQPNYSDLPHVLQRDLTTDAPQPSESQRLLTPQDVYAAVMYSSGSGGIAQRILQQYREKYLSATGTDMPADLVAKIQDDIAALSPSDQQQWLEESIAKPGSSIAIPALDSVLSAYEAEHPTPTMQQSQTASMIASAFEQTLGRAPTSADLAALGSDPSPGQVSDYLNNLPMPGYPGMTYGQYTTAHHNLDALWQSSFGRLPSQQELLWAVGKSSAQLSDFVDNSPSAIPGVTMGRYNDLTNWIKSTSTSGATTHAFSAGVDDSLVQSLHNQLQSASTGHAQPGPLP